VHFMACPSPFFAVGKIDISRHHQPTRTVGQPRPSQRPAFAGRFPRLFPARCRAAPAAVRASVARATEAISGPVSSAKCRRLHPPTAGRFLRRLPPRLPWPSRAIPGPPSPAFPFGFVRLCPVSRIAASTYCVPKNNGRFPLHHERRRPLWPPRSSSPWPADPSGFPPRQMLRQAQGVLCRALIGKQTFVSPHLRGWGFRGRFFGRLGGGRP
jgi:hypothetical protein